MSATGTQGVHLRRQELTGSGVSVILSRLGEWLVTAKFDPDGQVEKCADEELEKRCLPLFIELGIHKKIHSRQTRYNYNVLRIQTQEPAEFYNSVGETDLIPIRIIEGDPTVSDAPPPTVSESPSTAVHSQRLEPGSMIHITKDVKISRALYCLVVVAY